MTTEQEDGETERRHKSPWNWLRRKYKTLTKSAAPDFRKLFWAVTTAAALLGMGQCVGIGKTFALLPGQVAALTVHVNDMRPRMVALGDTVTVMQRGQSIEVAWKCIDYSVSDTARFNASIVACAEAMISSRMDPKYWNRFMVGRP